MINKMVSENSVSGTVNIAAGVEDFLFTKRLNEVKGWVRLNSVSQVFYRDISGNCCQYPLFSFSLLTINVHQRLSIHFGA